MDQLHRILDRQQELTPFQKGTEACDNGLKLPPIGLSPGARHQASRESDMLQHPITTERQAFVRAKYRLDEPDPPLELQVSKLLSSSQMATSCSYLISMLFPGFLDSESNISRLSRRLCEPSSAQRARVCTHEEANTAATCILCLSTAQAQGCISGREVMWV